MFRFTIRDILWLTVVVAMVVGWLVDRRALLASADLGQSKYLALQRLVKESSHHVEYDGDMPVGIKMFMHIREVPDRAPLATFPPTD